MEQENPEIQALIDKLNAYLNDSSVSLLRFSKMIGIAEHTLINVMQRKRRTTRMTIARIKKFFATEEYCD